MKHARSSSCDVKIIRSNSNNSDIDTRLNMKKFRKGHSRTSSNDYEYLNNQLNANNPNNIRYIVNHLKKPMSNLNSNYNLNSNFKHRRRHMRNYSYGQEFSFLPNNAIIRLDNDLANSFLLSTSNQNSKHHSRKNSFDPSHIVDINILTKKLNSQLTGGMLLNEEDNGVIQEEEQCQNIESKDDTTSLRHRRTNSNELDQLKGIDEGNKSSDLDIVEEKSEEKK